MGLHMHTLPFLSQVAWEGLPVEANSWEPVEHLQDLDDWDEVLLDFEENLEARIQVYALFRA